MPRVHLSTRSSRSPEPILLWALSDGTRCMFTSFGSAIELQLVSDETMLRCAHFVDIRLAYNAAQQWRLDYEVERESRRERNEQIRCPECGDEASSDRPPGSESRWLCCRSCGDVWILPEADLGNQH